MLAARAGAIGFLTLGTLVFAAAAAGHDLRGAALFATGASFAFAAILVCCYERLGRQVNRLLAFAGTLIIAELTLLQPSGELYAPLYLGIIIYVAFFFSRKQALMQFLVAVSLWGIAVGHVHSVGDAAQIWILGAGTLAGAAAMTTRDARPDAAHS